MEQAAVLDLPATPGLPSGAPQRVRRRLVAVLVATQVLSGLGQSGAVAGALLAYDLTGSDAAASLPLALIVLGATALALPVGVLSGHYGRRLGLTVALTAGGVGAAGTVTAGLLHQFGLLLVASVLFGAGNTAVMLARYAAADLVPPARRGRAISLVVGATTVGAVAAPNLLPSAGHLAGRLGLPPLTGLYLVSTVAYLLAAVLLLALLRPEPRSLAVATGGPRETTLRPSIRHLLDSSAARAGLTAMVTANFVMVAVMSMAPVHLRQHDHSLSLVGLVVSLHVAGMFAPAPLTGWLTDRIGPLPVAIAGALTLLGSSALVATDGLCGFVMPVGLVLLGVGWNANLIAGSALLAAAVPVAHRPWAEGAGEVGMGAVAIGGTAIAGPVVGLLNYPSLAVTGAVVAAVMVLALWHAIAQPHPSSAVRR